MNTPSIIRTVFTAALELFVVLSLAEFLLPGFATNFIAMPAMAVALLILGLATAFRPPPKTKLHAPRYTLLRAIPPILTFPIVWLTLAPFGTLAFVAAAAASLVAGLSSYLLTHD